MFLYKRLIINTWLEIYLFWNLWYAIQRKGYKILATLNGNIAFIKALEQHHYGYTQLQIVADNLNTHQSESLVRHVAERSGFEGSLGVKGKSGILKNQMSRAEFLCRKSHKIVFNYTPKHASWMNQIEIWFGILMRKVLKRGNFISIDDLKSKLIGFINYHNDFYAHPYNWKYGNTVLKTKRWLMVFQSVATRAP